MDRTGTGRTHWFFVFHKRTSRCILIESSLIMNSLLVRGFTAFLVPSVLSVCCYLIAATGARLIFSTPRQIYISRLLVMLVFLGVWWGCYLPDAGRAYFGNGADPDNANRYARFLATQTGRFYGAQTIWAWFIVALLDRPRQKQNYPVSPDDATDRSQPL